jgi:hypothetical protein
MEFSVMLGILARLVYASAYVPYNWAMLKQGKKPSSVTWGIWSAICLLNLTTYFKVTGDVWMSIIPISNIFLCLGTFVVVLVVSGNKNVHPMDLLALAIGIVAAVVWWVYKSAVSANLLVQLAIIAGFIPTWRLVWKDYLHEKPGAWWIWSASYLIGLIVALMRGKGWADQVYYANCTILHASVPLLALYRSAYDLSKRTIGHRLRSE